MKKIFSVLFMSLFLMIIALPHAFAAGPGFDIYLFDGANIKQLTDNSFGGEEYPDINEEGDIVWAGRKNDAYNIFLYKQIDKSITQLTNNFNSNDAADPQINNNGHIAWSQYQRYQTAATRQIFFNDGEVTKQITDPNFNNYWFQMNNNDHIVWGGEVRDDQWQIFSYDGVSTNQITNSNINLRPDINDNAEIVWEMYDDLPPKKWTL